MTDFGVLHHHSNGGAKVEQGGANHRPSNRCSTTPPLGGGAVERSTGSRVERWRRPDAIERVARILCWHEKTPVGTFFDLKDLRKVESQVDREWRDHADLAGEIIEDLTHGGIIHG